MARYEISIIGNMAGQAIVNVHGLDFDNVAGPETPSEAAAAAERAFSAWKAAFMIRLSSGYTVTQAIARGVSNGAISGTSTSGPASGQRAETPLPTFAVARIKLQTVEPGRAGRGRTGLSGLIETYTDAASPNTLSGAALIDLQPQVQQWFNALKGGAPPAQLTVISRVLGGVKRANPVVTDVDSVQLQAQLGTRVSRLR
jgi:hypothetical protein